MSIFKYKKPKFIEMPLKVMGKRVKKYADDVKRTSAKSKKR